MAHIRKSLFGLVAGLLAGVVVALALGVVLPFGERPPRDLLFFANLFKLVVGFYCISFALYAYYGPFFYDLGYARKLLPPEEIPVAIIVVYFVLGTLVLLTGFRAITLDTGVYLFLRVLAYAGFFGVATGFGVYTYIRSVERAESDANESD